MIEDNLPDWVRKGRVPHLDALRAIAIAMVIGSHLGIIPKGIWAGVFNGHLGVTLFFAISGFLITLLLLREHDRTGRISLKAFYYRRVLRIFPAYYAYLLIGLGLSAIGLLSVSKGYWVAAFTYMMCYMPDLNLGWHIGHFWSLAVEEHFYLLWPLLLVLFSPSRACKIVIAYIMLIPLIRYAIWALQWNWLDIDFCSITQMSSIAEGCLLAFVVRGSVMVRAGAWLKRYPEGSVVLGLGLLLLSWLACRSGKYTILFGDPVNALSCCIIIGGLLYIRSTFMIRLLNNRIVLFLGTLSYSLYIWQQPFSGPSLVGDISSAWRLIGIFGVALVSYYLIERPFLKMKERGAAKADEGICSP
jgi:peptidoglycan/LPS O-acetylase OafA/YrhL